MKNSNKKLHKLNYWRGVLGYNQSDMGLLLGYKASNYSQKELGKIEFTLSELKVILKTFNAKLTKLGMPTLTMEELFFS